MTPDISRWQTSSTYDYLDHLTASDVGWEYLRRNDDYQRDYAEIAHPAGDLERLIGGARQRWGLRFPGEAVAQGHRSPGVLVRGGRYGRRPADERPAHSASR
ncbi:DUF6499 domain-containing protein [Xanthobacter autotrophicus]|nr:DUF6499 domain-containing protein [Xanthobacter autotrophicus]